MPNVGKSYDIQIKTLKKKCRSDQFGQFERIVLLKASDISSPSLNHSDLRHKRNLWDNPLKCLFHRLLHNRQHLILYAISGLDNYFVV